MFVEIENPMVLGTFDDEPEDDFENRWTEEEYRNGGRAEWEI